MPPSQGSAPMADAGTTLSEPLMQKPGAPPPAIELGFKLMEPLDGEFVRACVGEFVATFIFLFISVGTVILLDSNNDYTVESGVMDSGTRLLIGFIFGLSIFVLVYSFAEVSGGHLNPAVSLCLALGNRISIVRFVFFTIFQCAGGAAGIAVFREISIDLYESTGKGVNAVSDGFEAKRALIGEIVCTANLCLTVLFATNTTTKAASVHVEGALPLAIGMAVALGNILLAPVDGCSINPARSFAAALVADTWDDQWVFWTGPMLGAVVAILIFELLLKPRP